MAVGQHTVHADESISVPTWTRPQAGKSVPVQKWNSPQREKVHYTDQMEHQMTSGGIQFSTLFSIYKKMNEIRTI